MHLICSTLALLFYGLFVLDAEAQMLEQQWKRIELGTHLGISNIWSIDLDGDGQEEVLFGGNGSGYGGNRFFSAFRHKDGDYMPVWTSPFYPENGIAVIEVVEQANGPVLIYVLLTSGQLEVYAGDTFALIDTASLQAEEAKAMQWVDVDNDGAAEIVICAYGYLQVYDAESYDLEWSSTEYGGLSFAVGDVDGDTDSEIVLSGGSGRVLDGATGALEWEYIGGFGYRVGVGDLEGDNVPEIIGMDDWDLVTVFDGMNRSPLRQLDTDDDLESLLVTDVSGDGRPDIVVGDGQWGNIEAYDAVTLEQLWSIRNPEHSTTNLAVGDPDGDGGLEVIWGAGHTSTGKDQLFIADIDSRMIEWSSLDLDGPFMTSVWVGEDVAEIFAASHESDSHYHGGYLLAYDAVSHQLKRTSQGSWQSINELEVGDLDGDGEPEVVAVFENELQILNADFTQRQSWNMEATVGALTIAQLDQDPPLEIVVGDTQGYVTIFDGESYAQEWRSISTRKQIASLVVADVDTDDALEIIFANEGSIVQIYDSEMHLLEWQSSQLDASALTVADTNRDGSLEIFVGQQSGGLVVIQTPDFTTEAPVQVAAEKVSSVAVANLDETEMPELLVGSSTLRALTADGKTLLWESEALGGWVGQYGDLVVADIDQDQLMDVVVGSRLGIFHYEATTPYPDTTPPRVERITPKKGRVAVSRDVAIEVVFSELMDIAMFSSGVTLRVASGAAIGASTSYDASTSTLTITPDALLPPESEIRVTISGAVTDMAGNGLDGNLNGVDDGSPLDDLSWVFITGTGVDTVGPEVTSIVAEPDSTWPDVPITITAHISDSSAVATSFIAEAEAYLDGDTTATGLALDALDEAFDDTEETVRFTLNTEGFSPGLHVVYIRGRDSRGYWGPLARIEITLLGDPDASNWAMFGQDPQHTGFSTESLKPPFVLDWSVNASGENEVALNPVAVQYGLVVVTHRTYFGVATVRAYDSQTGEMRWQRALGSVSSFNPPSMGYGRVFVQTGKDGQPPRLSAISVEDGKLLWQSSFGAQWERYFAPTLWGGNVYINGGTYGGMYAFDAFTGVERWFVGLGQYDEWTPGLYDGTAYAYVGGQLTAVDALTGAVHWNMNDIAFDWRGWSMGTAPVISADANVVLTTSSQNLHAIDLSAHSIRWEREGTFGITPATDGTYVFAIEGGGLQVFNITNGGPVWAFVGDGNLAYPPVVTSNYVFVSSQRNVYAIDRSTYEAVWTYPKGGPLTLANGRLYIAGLDGMLYAFRHSVPTRLDEEVVPVTYALHPAYPNPFRTTTTISYDVAEAGKVSVQIFDLLGRQVAVLVDAHHTVGRHQVRWAANDLASGTYYCQMRTGAYSRTIPLTLVR